MIEQPSLLKSNSQGALLTATEIVLPGIVEPNGLLIQTRSLNNPKSDEVILKMLATGVSFAEKSMRKDQYPGMPKFPFVPGYDLVGTVVAVGNDADKILIGKQFACLTLTGGWATYATVKTVDLLPIPEGINPVDAETLIVNGVTAWQMLHRDAKIKKGNTILVYGANGGVGTILTQLAQISGVKVIGASSSKYHEILRNDGVIPVDYADKNLAQTIRSISPEGIDAVFDNIGGKSLDVSFGLLKKGGTMVSYALMSKTNSNTIRMMQFMYMVCKVLLLNILPNGKNTAFYYIWSGKGTDKFRAKMKEDFASLMNLLLQNKLKPKIAATFPLAEISKAMYFSESRTAYGKVVLVP
jgi:NADPH:quinone reductase-like Zn-dependent oxidoreductase